MNGQEDSRHLPYDVSVQEAVLGALLVDNKNIDIAVGAGLKAETFYSGFHQRLFDMVVFLQTEGAVTPLVVASVMKTDPGWAELKVTPRDYLVALVQAAPAMPNIRDLARILLDLAVRRDLITIGEDLVNDAYEAPKDQPSRITIGRATERLLSIGDLTARRLSKMGDAAGASLKRLEERLERQRTGQKPLAVTTGLRKLDRALGGLLPGDRVGIAARSQMGKSLLSSSMSLAAAMSGAPVLIISADMREQQWAERVICDMDRHLNPDLKPIHYRRFRTGDWSPDEWERIVLAQQELAGLPMYIDDNPVATVETINGRTRALAQAHPDQQGLLIADFLQKIGAPSRSGYQDRRRDQDVTDVAYGLGDIVKPLGWSLGALIQIKSDTDAKGALREDPPAVTAIRECVTGSTRLVDATTGHLVPIRDIHPGQIVLGLNSDHKTEAAQVRDVWQTGVRETLVLVTKGGRSLSGTANHPILTDRGWVDMGDLKPTDLIACAFRTIRHGKEIPERADLCRFLGYMIGNGTMQKGRTSGLILPDAAAFSDAVSIMKHSFPDVEVHVRSNKYNDAWFSRAGGRRGHGQSSLHHWLSEIGLMGTRDYTKFVPAFVFEAGIIGAIEFLNGYMAADGCVTGDDVRFDTTSPILAADVQHLLARMGISSGISKGRRSKKAVRDIFAVTVAYEHRAALSQMLKVRGYRGERLGKLGAALLARPNRTRSSSLSLPKSAVQDAVRAIGFKDQGKKLSRILCTQLARQTKDKALSRWAHSDVIWEPIRSISTGLPEPVFDISIPGINNFLANGVVAHNSQGVEMAFDILFSPYRLAFFIERRNDPIEIKNLALAEPCAAGWATRNHMRLIGWKNRDGSALDLNMDLWCEPGSAAVRDAEPKKYDAAEQAADQLAMTV